LTSEEEQSDSQVGFSFSDDSKTLVPYQYGQNSEKLTLVIQMEFCGGTLREWLDGTERPSDVSRNLWFTYRRLRTLIMFWDVMNGVETVHLRGLVHHDIKVLFCQKINS
jgi:serine/threonine protein kinase